MVAYGHWPLQAPATTTSVTDVVRVRPLIPVMVSAKLPVGVVAMVDTVIVEELTPAGFGLKLALAPAGNPLLHHQLVRGTTPVLDTVRADSVIQRYRQMKAATKTPRFSREDAIHLIDVVMGATTKYWNQFYPPPVGVGGPVDIAIISSRGGFSWYRKK